MPGRGQWVFDPNSGGKKIPEPMRREIEKRIGKVAEEHFKGKYSRLDVRFRGQFCYIDAYTEPEITEGWPPPVGQRRRKNTRKDCVTPRCTCADCATLVTTAGALPFTLTAMKSMSFRYFPMAILSVPPRMLS